MHSDEMDVGSSGDEEDSGIESQDEDPQIQVCDFFSVSLCPALVVADTVASLPLLFDCLQKKRRVTKSKTLKTSKPTVIEIDTRLFLATRQYAGQSCLQTPHVGEQMLISGLYLVGGAPPQLSNVTDAIVSCLDSAYEDGSCKWWPSTEDERHQILNSAQLIIGMWPHTPNVTIILNFLLLSN